MTNVTIIVWGYRLSKKNIDKLKMIQANTNEQKFKFIYYVFPFEDYPKHVDISIEAGQYAWKVISIHSVIKKFHTPVLWLDGGCLLRGNVDYIFNEIHETGFWGVTSYWPIYNWTHKSMLKYYNMSIEYAQTHVDCLGGLVAFDPNHEKGLKLIEKWYECSILRDCIAPKGSSRNNHRHDQSALSVLVHKLDLKNKCIGKRINISIHKDFKVIFKKFDELVEEIRKLNFKT